MTFSKKKRVTPVRTDRFGERVKFTGNLDRIDLSVTLSDVQLKDEGIYKCHVRNPPDRIQGVGRIMLYVVTERKISTLPSAHTKQISVYTISFAFKT